MINKRKKDKFGNGLIAFLFICIIFLLCYAFKNPVLLYSSNPEVEINHEYDPKENIQQVFFHSDSDVKISGDINTNKIGNYEITYQLKNYKKTCKVSVKDTKAPDLKLKAYKADMKEDMNILIGTAQVEMLHPIPCQHKILCAMRQVAIMNKL